LFPCTLTAHKTAVCLPGRMAGDQHTQGK
jgi:hypothetical protein